MKISVRWILMGVVGCGSPSEPGKTGGGVDSAVPDAGDTDGDTDDTDDPGDTDDTDDPRDDTGTDTGDDTGTPEWITLPDSCALPTPDGTDPFIEIGSEINQTGSWFTEILDVEYLPDLDRVLTAGQGGVVVFDVTDPTNPDTRGHVSAGSGPFERYYHVLEGDEDRMFATHRDVGVHIVSWADEDVLFQTAMVTGTGWEGLDRSGDRLYVANLEGQLDVFDVSVPDALTWRSNTTGLGRPWDVLVQGDVAYVADGALGLVTLSLSNPDAPVVMGAVASDGQPVRLKADDAGYLYVAGGSSGLEIYETSDPLAPTRIAQLDPGGSALDVTVHDGLVGVTTQEAVVLYDVGNAGTPEAPLPFSYEETELFAMSLDAAAGQWMVGDWNILSVWETGTDPAPAIDLSLGVLAFLDEAETREVTVTNRGSATLDLAGIDVPSGLTAVVDRAAIPPGETATMALSWDGSTEMARGTFVCIASDDPSRGEIRLKVSSGSEGDGRALGQNAPDFALEDLDGTVRRLSDELGNPVVLAYFATW